MSASTVLAALLVAVLGWSLLGEALHAGVALSGVLPGSRHRLPPWQVLGPLVLLDEVWPVVALAWVQTGFPATEVVAWERAWAPLLAAVLCSVVLFVLLLLGPLLESARGYRLGVAGAGMAAPTLWTAALACAAHARVPVPAVAAGALVATAAAAALGLGFSHLRSSHPSAGCVARTRGLQGPRRRAAAAAAGGALAVVGLLAWALGGVAPELLTSTAAPTTRQLLAVCAAVSLPVALALQVGAWRWVLRRPPLGAAWLSLPASVPTPRRSPR